MSGEPAGAVRLRIRGRVQGVFFRAWTASTARELGLSGWVRNRSDGSVEVLASGSPQALSQLIERCRRGPPAARVDSIEQDVAEPASGEFETRPSE